MDNQNQNSMREMVKSDFGDTKLDKSRELNETMTIAPDSQDEYTRVLHNLNGGKN